MSPASYQTAPPRDVVNKNLITKSGGPGGDRTRDTRIFSPVLYQLSYRTIVAEKEGFEPPRSFRPLSVFKTDPFSLLGISPTIIAVLCFIKLN